MENRINQKKYIPLKDYSPIDPAELPADLQDDLMNLTGAIPIWEQPGTQKDSIALISRNGDLLRTEGYIGFVQIREYQIFIKSRFDGENDNNFTNYLISKALDINARLFDRMHVPAERARAMEKLLAVAFVQKVRQAYKKGIFRQYRTFERNDAKVKGKIDFTRHIKYNPLPNGRIAYSYREYTPDNDMNRLFLTAYEELMKRHGGLMRILLERERTVTECITKMKNFVSPVSKQETQKLLKKTNKKIEQLITVYSLGLLNNNTKDASQKDREDYLLLRSNFDKLIQSIRESKISGKYRGLMLWLLDRAFNITPDVSRNNRLKTKLSLNKVALMRILYEVNREEFLKCFSSSSE